MREVVKYQADDGSTWDTAGDAMGRDRLVAWITRAMAPLGPIPANAEWLAFSNGRVYVQHTEPAVIEAKGLMLGILTETLPSYAKEHPEWFEVGVHHRTHVLSRIVDDHGGPIDKAWQRIICIDGKFREWGQPFYVGDPNSAAKAWKKIALLMAFMVGLSGCETLRESGTANILPTKAIATESFGNGWSTFTIEVAGRKRTFLYHYLEGTKDGLESVMELQP